MTPRTTRRARMLAAALLTWLSTACGRAAPDAPPEPAPAPDPCLLPTGRPGEPRALVVAATRPEDTAAVAGPQPEPVIRLDCTGAARPGAAEAWMPDSTGRAWTLVLAASALEVSAGSAAAEWRTRPEAATTLRHAGIASVVPLDERRLVVTLDRSYDSVPRVFADPSLALVTDSTPVVGPTFILRRFTGDPRDALDGGADILPTDDPELLEYARARDELLVHALPWSRTYVLIIPPGQHGFEGLIPADSATFRAGLARDAVRVEARAAEGPYWWTGAGPCPEAERSATASARGLRLTAQAWDDPVGRAIAERLVARSGGPMRVTGGLDPRSPVPTIHSELGTAYVVPVPRTALVPCREIAAWPAGATVVPLIETRRSVVVRRGVRPLTVDLDGRLRATEAP
jgi:hypothetical protein